MELIAEIDSLTGYPWTGFYIKDSYMDTANTNAFYNCISNPDKFASNGLKYLSIFKTEPNSLDGGIDSGVFLRLAAETYALETFTVSQLSDVGYPVGATVDSYVEFVTQVLANNTSITSLNLSYNSFSSD